MVDDLRPPAIDEVGLVGAVRQRAEALSAEAQRYVVTGPESLPLVPAAVEVAAYRIASEAMTNVAKHARASRCTVDITVDGPLTVTITDNGQGSRAPSATGWGGRRCASGPPSSAGPARSRTVPGGGPSSAPYSRCTAAGAR